MASRTPIALELLRRVELFRALDDTQLRQISPLLHEKGFAKGETIFDQGDAGDCLYIILTGYVRIFLLSPDGREITVQVYGSGQAFGEFAVLDGQPRSAGAVAEGDVATWVVYRDDFQGLLRSNFTLVENMLGVLTARLRFTTRVAERLAFLSAAGRIAGAITQLAARATPSPRGLQIKVTQQSLAAHAGVTREWTNRALNTFATEGLISLERGTIILLDSDRLAHWAEK